MDIMVSSYYFHQMAVFLEDPGTFDEFMEKFLDGRGQRSHTQFTLISICISAVEGTNGKWAF